VRSLARLSLVVSALGCAVVVDAGCSRDGDATSAPDEPRTNPSAPRAPREEPPSAPRALVVEGRGRAFCIQVKSVNARDEAARLVERLSRDLSLSAHVFEADLGDKGTWFRVCAGAFPDEESAHQKAKEWTAEGGALRPFMDDVQPGQAAYFVKERPTTGKDALPPAISRALESVPGVPVRVRVQETPAGEIFAVDAHDGEHARTSLFDDQGAELAIAADTGALACAPCATAIGKLGVARLTLHASGPLTRDAGDELLVDETLADGSMLLTVLRTDVRPLVRAASFWLGKPDAARRRGIRAVLVDLDGGPTKEVALVREDLALAGDDLCAIERRVDVFLVERADDRGALVRVDASVSDPKKPLPRVRLVEIEDALGDTESASVGCGRAAAQGDSGAITRCQARVLSLRANGQLVDAVSAAGLLSEASSKVRPLIALGLLDAARALDASTQKTVVVDDCAAAPLVRGFVSSLDGPLQGFVFGEDDDGAHKALRAARTAARARHDLGELHDAVFVTARRDFGPEAPFGALAERWLAELKAVLPARAAAIEALLVAPPSRPQ